MRHYGTFSHAFLTWRRKSSNGSVRNLHLEITWRTRRHQGFWWSWGHDSYVGHRACNRSLVNMILLFCVRRDFLFLRRSTWLLFWRRFEAIDWHVLSCINSDTLWRKLIFPTHSPDIRDNCQIVSSEQKLMKNMISYYRIVSMEYGEVLKSVLNGGICR